MAIKLNLVDEGLQQLPESHADGTPRRAWVSRFVCLACLEEVGECLVPFEVTSRAPDGAAARRDADEACEQLLAKEHTCKVPRA